MIKKLLLFFVALPLVELCLMLLLSHYVLGVTGTILFIIGTGILGTWLANTQGVSTYRRIQEELRQGRMPTNSLIDGVLILVAGVLLISPGVITDLTGIFLMFPPSRALFRRAMIAWFQRHFKIQALPSGFSRREDSNVVDSFATETKPSSTSQQPRRLEG